MASGFELWDEETTLTWHKDDTADSARRPSAAKKPVPPTLRGVGPARHPELASAEPMPASLTKTDVWDAAAFWDSTERKTSPGGRAAAAAFEAARVPPVIEGVRAEWIEAESVEEAPDVDNDPRESGERDRIGGVGEAASRGLWWTGITLVTMALLAITVGGPALDQPPGRVVLLLRLVSSS